MIMPSVPILLLSIGIFLFSTIVDWYLGGMALRPRRHRAERPAKREAVAQATRAAA